MANICVFVYVCVCVVDLPHALFTLSTSAFSRFPSLFFLGACVLKRFWYIKHSVKVSWNHKNDIFISALERASFTFFFSYVYLRCRCRCAIFSTILLYILLFRLFICYLYAILCCVWKHLEHTLKAGNHVEWMCHSISYSRVKFKVLWKKRVIEKERLFVWCYAYGCECVGTGLFSAYEKWHQIEWMILYHLEREKKTREASFIMTLMSL